MSILGSGLALSALLVALGVGAGGCSTGRELGQRDGGEGQAVNGGNNAIGGGNATADANPLHLDGAAARVDAAADGRDGAGGSALASNGSACTSPGTCASNNCVESFCCDKPCGDACYSCRNALTGSAPNGTCALIASGKDDPLGRCGTATATAGCGATGHCDGKGACEKYGSTTICLAAACAGGNFSPASTCNGKGACTAGTTQNCAGFACSAASGCATSCTSDLNCTSGYCAISQCAAKKIDGAICVGNNECIHGQCVGGICCESSCTDTCLSCAVADTGAASGLCRPILAGGGAKGKCAAETTLCGRDGTCDGTGACRLKAPATGCVSNCANGGATCSPGQRCTSLGSCIDNCSGVSCAVGQKCATTSGLCVDDLLMLTVATASVGGATGSVASQSSPTATQQIACGTTCVGSFKNGTSVTLNATPGSGSYFGAWSGACAGSGPSCTFTLTGNLTITATFTRANLAFVSPGTYTVATLGGVTGADATCNQLATAAGKSGAFVAWISTATSSVVTRLGNARGWVRPDGRPFLDKAIDQPMFYPPEIDPSGRDVGVDQTAAGGNGLAGSVCANWTSTAGADLPKGDPSGGPEIWNGINYAAACSSSFYIYCFQKDYSATLTFPKAVGRIAFLTDGAFNPGKGAQGADDLCALESSAAHLPGTYLAYLATTTRSIASRFSFGASTLPWVRPDGVQIVAAAADLFTRNGKTIAPINVTPTLQYRGNWGALTGATDPTVVSQGADGCNNWSSNDPNLLAWGGSPARTRMQWVVGYYQSLCSNTGVSVYCLQR